ncbi:hypothetical protein GOODEAATRI_007598 [Goodea atripinnis]|uniref:Uncharacterized protein n=1 Tax=Goodea atripinnis TaxID=208336 RepID=A0ABV0MQ40_9TELE
MFLTQKHSVPPPPGKFTEKDLYKQQALAIFSWRKRHCRRGRHSGCLMKLRARLAKSDVYQLVHGLFPSVFLPLSFLEPVDACLVPLVDLDDVSRPQRPWGPGLVRVGRTHGT